MNKTQRVLYKYVKKSGILEPPPRIYEEVLDFVVTKYAGHVLANVRDKIKFLQKEYEALIEGDEERTRKRLVRVTRLKELIESKYTTEAHTYKSRAHTKVSLDVSGWSYLDQLKQSLQKSIEDAIQRLTSVFTDLDGHLDEVVDGDRDELRILVPTYKVNDRFDQGLSWYIYDVQKAPEEKRDQGLWEIRDRGIHRQQEPNLLSQGQTFYVDTKRDLYEYVSDNIEEALDEMRESLQYIQQDGWANRMIKDIYDTSITVILDFEGHKTRGGVWKEMDRELQVDVPYATTKPKRFKKVIEKLRQTVEHETMHVGQTLIDKLAILDSETGGMPSDLIRRPGRNRDDKPHALRPEEFYTRLKNEADRFVNKLEGYPVEMRKPALRHALHIEPEKQKRKMNEIAEEISGQEFMLPFGSEGKEFFKKLKQEEPDKWQKAVKEMVKEVGKRLDM